MLSKLLKAIRDDSMLEPGEQVVCAVSGGADSMALLYAMQLLAPKLNVCVSAAHFNHHLRGEESDRDEQFVRDFCRWQEIPLYVGEGQIVSGEKGLEAAAREARYAFLKTLPGKIATAHTANDNAETVLMHMLRGTGLKGLGGVAPVSDRLIRPMLSVTREEVLAFLREYHISYVEDSSNRSDQFLRNRLRHHVMPLLEQENPRLAENLSAMALRLREDEKAISQLAGEYTTDIPTLRSLPPFARSRALAAFLESCGVREPEAEHIALAEKLVFSNKPSAKASFPNGVVISRSYSCLTCEEQLPALSPRMLQNPGTTEFPELGLRITCSAARQCRSDIDCFTVIPTGQLQLRCRQSGDEMRVSGGTKSLKKLFIDKKIPAAKRLRIPVIADSEGVLGVYGIGPNLDRLEKSLPAVEICIEALPTAVWGK
jgi:tRNA(Ile)-lysidine synthase